MPPGPPSSGQKTQMIGGIPRLIIQDAGQPPREIPLENRPLKLGRAPDNDIRVDSRFVSKNHARIEPDGPGHRIVDVGSTNGLLYNGQRVPQRQLVDGDVIRIGDPVTGNFVNLTYSNPALRHSTAELTIAGRFQLNSPNMFIGREGNDINLPNPQVSRRHAQISAAGDGHQIRDLGSTNGTFVNGLRITSHQLRRGEVIQIGPFKLVYNGNSLDQFDQRGAMRIDARNLVRVVGGGKVILNDVTIVIEPREFVALVGGSGAGKSTLMGSLSGFTRATHGMVMVNGDDYYRNFDAYRTVLGYVPQDDILHRTLPVDRALRYAAKLRLPDDTSEKEIESRVARVLEDVEMSAHRQKRVENLSGGQRKRVSIASELLADPSLFFLDEPTSGLDPGLEKKMMYTMRQLADSGRTIVLVTHATANIKLCDHVAFMAEGRMVYYGPPHQALDFFNVSSGDFADIYNKLEGPAEENSPLLRDLQNEYTAWRQRQQGQPARMPMLAELWEIRFRGSEIYRKYVWERVQHAPSVPAAMSGAPMMPQAPPPMQPPMAPPGRMGIVAPGPGMGTQPGPGMGQATGLSTRPKQPPVSSWRQFRILTRRYFDLVASDRRNLMILLLQAPVIALLMLLVAKADDYANTISQHGRLTSFLLATVAVWFGILNSAREITKESPVYRRERLANLRIGPYVASKVGVLAALCLIQSIILMVVLSLKVDFNRNEFEFPGAGTVSTVDVSTCPDAGTQPPPQQREELFFWSQACDLREQNPPPLGIFGGFLLTTFLTSLTGMALGLAISASVTSPDKAMSIIPFALIPQIIFALALVPLPGPMVPLANLAASKWAMEGYGSIAAMVEPYDAGGNFPGVSYDHSAGHIFLIWFVLLAYSGALLGLTAWLLKRRDKQI